MSVYYLMQIWLSGSIKKLGREHLFRFPQSPPPPGSMLHTPLFKFRNACPVYCHGNIVLRVEGGVTVIGQEQDQRGDDFSAPESFR